VIGGHTTRTGGEPHSAWRYRGTICCLYGVLRPNGVLAAAPLSVLQAPLTYNLSWRGTVRGVAVVVRETRCAQPLIWRTPNAARRMQRPSGLGDGRRTTNHQLLFTFHFPSPPPYARR
jgi:hypothetical protein